MNRKKRILLSFFLMLAVSLSAPAVPSTGSFYPLAVTAEAHHHGSHHRRKAKIVYITRTGECYHTHKCGNGTYYKCTLKKAKSCHLRPCKKCF